MIPYQHQVETAEQGYALLKQWAICYLACEERTGKTLSALLIAEIAKVQNILIVTKKAALPGWKKTLQEYKGLTKCYTLINYHRVKNITGKFDLVVLDEAHNYISGYPKQSKLWKEIKKHTKDLPIIYMSATPYAQTPALLYHQFALSNWSPFSGYTSYYNWWKRFGTGETKWISGRQIPCYDKVKDKEVLSLCNDLFITKTRKELNFSQEPEDKIHYVELSNSTKKAYNTLVNDKVIFEPLEFVADTVMLLRTGLHQLEGGTLKLTSVVPTGVKPTLVKQRKEAVKDEGGNVLGYKYHDYHVLYNNEKVQYILDNWGDSSDVAIMYNYIGEGFKLNKYFKHTRILQATSNAEGISLKHVKHLIIYSQDFSTARHTQRRARQADKTRTEPIIVHYLLTKDGLSEQVYNTVVINKLNYIDSLFFKEQI